MDDFIWTLQLGTMSFGIVMNECKDGSPWFGECLVDGVDVGYEAVAEAVMERFDINYDAAAIWLDEALERRLNWQRGKLLRQNPPALKVV